MNDAGHYSLDDLEALLAEPASENALENLRSKHPPHPILGPIKVTCEQDALPSRQGPLGSERRIVDFQIKDPSGKPHAVRCEYFSYVVLLMSVLAGVTISLNKNNPKGRFYLKLGDISNENNVMVFSRFICGIIGDHGGNTEDREEVFYVDGNTLNLCSENLQIRRSGTAKSGYFTSFKVLLIGAATSEKSAFFGTPNERLAAAMPIFDRAFELLRDEHDGLKLHAQRPEPA